MATKRIDDGTRPELTTLEAGYKVLVDSSTNGTKRLDLDKFVGTDDVGTIASLDYWTGTQAAYDLLTPDSNTLYIIIG